MTPLQSKGFEHGDAGRRWFGCVAAALLLACAAVAPPVDHPWGVPQVEAIDAGLTEADLVTIALVPFAAGLELGRTASPRMAQDAPALVTRFVGDALAGVGRFGIASDRMALALARDGRLVLPVDPVSAALRSRELFGATSVLVGEVKSYSRAGTRTPAAIHFEAHLHSARDGRRLWSATVRHGWTAAATAEDAGEASGVAPPPTPEDLARLAAERMVRVLLTPPVDRSAP